jgi:DNA-binding XRE family transcriptional regulator
MENPTYGPEIQSLRKSLGLSQQGFAEIVGLTSKSHVSDIERGASCSPSVALAIERLSEGRIPAVSLSRSLANVLAAQSAAA